MWQKLWLYTNWSGRLAPEKTATPEQAQEVHAAIRELISRHSGPNVGNRVRIQYGGSVPENANSLLGQPDINGALVAARVSQRKASLVS